MDPSQMRKNALKRDIPTPDEASHCLHKGAEAPDLAMVKVCGKSPLWVESPAGVVASPLTGFAGRCPGVTNGARSSLEVHLSDQPAVDEEQP
jgi:hypothetical protein